MTNESRLDYRDPEWVAQQLGIDKNAVYRYLDEGTLPGLRLGRKWLISEASLLEFLKRREREQTQHRQADSRRKRAMPYGKFMKRTKRFAERGKRAMASAREEALALNHNHIGQEHLLLGLLKERDCVAAKILKVKGIQLRKVRSAVEAQVGRGDESTSGEVYLTPQALKVTELAVREARHLQRYVDTEHILLGIVLAGEGIGFDLLKSEGVSLEHVQTELTGILSEPQVETNESREWERRRTKTRILSPAPKAPHRGDDDAPEEGTT